MRLCEINGASLAYLGDSVIEVNVRNAVIRGGKGKLGDMNKLADSMVKAVSQSVAIEKLLPLLTEDELASYRSGKNSHTQNTPKNAKLSEYKKATGMEALFGYLYLKGEHERIKELLSVAYGFDKADFDPIEQ